MSLVKMPKIHQEVLKKATGLALNSVTITYGVGVGVENPFHAPQLAYAVVNACKGILSVQIEQSRKLVLYLGPRVLPNNTVVHDRESLFVRVRGSSRPKDAPRRPSMCRLSRWTYSEAGIVIESPVWIKATTTGQVCHMTCVTQDLCGVGATGRRILGREFEDVGIMRVSRQEQMQGGSELRGRKLVTLWPGRGRM